MKNLTRFQKTSLNPKYSFENYLSCKSNKQVIDFCLCVIQKKFYQSSNFIHITGGPGVGKTHLLQAIGNKALDSQPGCKVRYYTSMEFLEEFVHRVSTRTLSDFYCSLSGADVILLDDVQKFAGKNVTLQEISSLLDKLRGSKILFVFASDKGPDELEGFEEHISGRFDFRILPLRNSDNATRKSILRKFSNENGIKLPCNVINFLARLTKDVRCLRGYLNRLVAESEFSKKKISLKMCRRCPVFS